jgi:flagellar assembly protein FliH
MITEPKKYTFDVEFRPEGDLISNAARARQRKVHTQEELDTMLSRARHDGMKVGQVRAAEQIAAAVEQLCTVVRESVDSAQDQIEDLRREAANLALVAGKKLAQHAVAALPEADVEAALREAIHQAISEPRIVLRAAPPVAAAIKEKLDELARDTGYEGRIVATPEPGMKAGDCRIEWRGGGAERSMEHLENAISEVIARRFSQVNSPRKG